MTHIRTIATAHACVLLFPQPVVVFHNVELGLESRDYNTYNSGASISVTTRALFADVAACPVTPMTKIEFTDGARAGLKVVVAIE